MSQPCSANSHRVGTSHVTLTFDNELTPAELENMRRTAGASDVFRIPAIVSAAYTREQRLHFEDSSEPDVGQLLAVIAALVPKHGRVLELGTGAGVGLAWIVYGLRDRTDVDVTSIELDASRAEAVRADGWPPWVSILVGNGSEFLEHSGRFDLIFADTPGGKIYNLATTINALREGGTLVLDDMDLRADEDPERWSRITCVRNQLFEGEDLVCAELRLSTGVLLAVKSYQN